MSLVEKIDKQLQEAIKNKEEDKTSTLKMLKSDIMYEKGKTGKDLSDEQALEVIARAAKKRKEAIKEYINAGRKDLADQEQSELNIIEKYLPEQMSESEVEKIIDSKLAEMGEVSKADFGKIMGTLMKELKGKTDGTIVKKLLNQKLESK